jgi:sodium transport system ATP-binding protein
MIVAENLHKNFGEVAALRGVSFGAGDGMVTGLLGPNGAGKTTTLRILYTLLSPDAGYARVDGFDTQDNRLEVQRRIGALPDSHGLYPRLTARENIRYYGRLTGLRGVVLEAAIDNLIKLLDMQDIEHRKTEGFSSGQRVKVAIARALVHEPQNVLLDEPSTGLDVMSTRSMRSFILRLRDEGKCVLFSSHVMQEVSALCENIYIINRGEVVACGSPDQLLAALGQEDLEEAFVSAIDSEEGNCDE